MKLKLDENIGRRGLELLRDAGHDVMTVREQKLEGAPDEAVFAACAGEGRALITLDRDFGEVLRFPPDQSAGIVVLDLGPRATLAGLLARLADFLAVAKTEKLEGALWIVQPGRVRIHIRD